MIQEPLHIGAVDCDNNEKPLAAGPLQPFPLRANAMS